MVEWGNPTRQISTLYLQVTPRQKGVINLLTGGPGVTEGSRPPCCFFKQADDVLTAKGNVCLSGALLAKTTGFRWDAYRVSDIKAVWP